MTSYNPNRKRNILMALGLVAVFVVSFLVIMATQLGPSAQPASTKASNPDQTIETPEGTLTFTNNTVALDAADTYYKEGKFETAELVYKHVFAQTSAYHTSRNNLGLALLQQGKNEEALAHYEILVSNLPRDKSYWQFGLNYMIAAHANELPAREVFDEFGDSEDELKNLIKKAEKNPSQNMKLLLAIYYNAVYMDMELDPNLPLDKYFNYELIGYDANKMNDLRTQHGDQWLQVILDDLNARNFEYFGEKDPDMELLTYYYQATRK